MRPHRNLCINNLAAEDIVAADLRVSRHGPMRALFAWMHEGAQLRYTARAVLAGHALYRLVRLRFLHAEQGRRQRRCSRG